MIMRSRFPRERVRFFDRLFEILVRLLSAGQSTRRPTKTTIQAIAETPSHTHSFRRSFGSQYRKYVNGMKHIVSRLRVPMATSGTSAEGVRVEMASKPNPKNAISTIEVG